MLNVKKNKINDYKALQINVSVAKTISNFVRSTFGPKGNSKMLINELGIVTITNDGATVLSELKVEHPTAKMIIEIAKTLKDTVGDGTTCSIILTSELLEKSYQLIKKGFSPSNIINCFKIIKKKSIEILDSNSININDKEINKILYSISKTSMTGNGHDIYNNHLSKICIGAINIIKNKQNIDIKNNIIQIVDINKSVEKTELVKGLVIATSTINYIGKRINCLLNSKIILFDENITEKTKIKAKSVVFSIKEKHILINQKNENILKIANKVFSLGANFIFTTKRISNDLLEYFEKKNIVVFKPIDDSIIKNISLATGGKIIRDWNSASIEDLGIASSLKCYYKNDDSCLVYLNECHNSKIATIVVRGETLQIANNVINSIDKALGSINSTLSKNKIVIGGGAIETEIMINLKQYSLQTSGYQQEIINKLSESFGKITKQLIYNAGYNSIDKFIELKKHHLEQKKYFGFNADNGKIIDLNEKKIYESYNTKKYTILTAFEIALMILRIDDILIGNKNIYNNESYNPNNYNKN